MGQTWQPSAADTALLPTPASVPALAARREASRPWAELARTMHEILAATVHR